MYSSDSRNIIVGNVGTKPSLKKQPNDVFFYLFDFTGWLGGDTTITSAVTTLLPSNADSPTLATPTVSGDGLTVKVLVSAGHDGWLGDITCRRRMVDGEYKEAEFELLLHEVDYVAPV